jgi:hypothetical protein
MGYSDSDYVWKIGKFNTKESIHLFDNAIISHNSTPDSGFYKDFLSPDTKVFVPMYRNRYGSASILDHDMMRPGYPIQHPTI